MADTKPVMEKQEASRYPGGPRPVSALIPRLIRPAFRGRAPATAQVLADWEVIVGPAIAAASMPRRLSAGTLTLSCTGPAALELQHASVQLMERINAHLGQAAVQRIRLVQETGGPEARSAGPAAPKVAGPNARARKNASLSISGLPEGGLRDALLALGEAVLTRAE